MENKIKAVFFDLYGTLFVFNNFDDANEKWINAFYTFVCKPKNIGFEETKVLCKKILESSIEKDVLNGYTTYETKIFKAFAQKNIFFGKDELRNIADNTVGAWQKNIVPAHDAKSVLSVLKETKKLALITNFDHSPHVYKTLSETGLKDLFDLILISDEAGCQKPDKAIFNYALNFFSLNPSQAVYVGDNIYDDIKGAFDAGIEPILIAREIKSNNCKNADELIRKYNLPEFKTINSLSELILDKT